MVMRTAGSETPHAVWLGSAAALAVGLPILTWGLLQPTAPVLAWFVPVCDAIAFVAMVVVALLGSLDAALRQNRRSLPIVFLASATAIMWAGHFAFFPGVIPAFGGQLYNQATSTIFLTINLLTPLLLFLALLVRGAPMERPFRWIVAANATGVITGLVVIGLAVLLGNGLSTVSPSGTFNTMDALVGVAGLIPVVLGLAAYLVGRHGDERIAAGVLAALTFVGLTSIGLLYLRERYSPSWYADHVLALLPFAALLAGQLWLYAGSVIAERRAAERRRIGLDVAKAMARETDLMPVVDRLLTGVMSAIGADRVTMLRLVPGGYVVERGIDREGRPANVGLALPLDSVVAGDRSVVREAVEERRPVVLGSYRVVGIDRHEVETHAGIVQSVVVPLVRGGSVDGVLIAGRRSDRPFTHGDVEQLEELGAIATLLIRNSRLLAEAASSSRAKSAFINLAAHELGTPISVVRGYIDMLSDESLGRLSERQRAAVDMVRMTAADLGERVEQLLVASRLEAGVPVIRDRSPATDIVKAVRDAVDRATPRARLMDAELTTAVPPHPLHVRCSDRDAAVILDNLLNNAMTYSKPPPRARLEVSEGEPVEVRVLDHGIGIPEEARDRIFDQFYRVDDVEFGYPSGTGLGLYISRQLAERNGGDLLLERSEHGQGSVFLLRLARATAQVSMA